MSEDLKRQCTRCQTYNVNDHDTHKMCLACRTIKRLQRQKHRVISPQYKSNK